MNSIATMNILEPRPIDPRRRMIQVENVPLVQSTFNDRILLDLHPWLEMERSDFLFSHDRQAPWEQLSPFAHRAPLGEDHSTSKQMPSKTIKEDEDPTRMKALLLANDRATPLVASSATVAETEPTNKDDQYDDLAESGDPEASYDPLVFRSSQLEQWNAKYQELVQFKKGNKHCSVPLHYPDNPSLAHWVKRQRHQYRMKKENKHSTLTDLREKKLESLGFVWDSHASAWDERWNQLSQFRDEQGHSRVPKKYPPNQSLSVWVKCQRRQFKLFSQGKPSNMTIERIRMLKALNFVFDPRRRSNRKVGC